MFGLSTAAAAVLGGALVAAGSVYSSKVQAKATRYAANVQREASDKALKQQTTEFRQANQNTAGTESILDQNAGSDTGSTMLTGPGGISLDDLILGKGANLLGGNK